MHDAFEVGGCGVSEQAEIRLAERGEVGERGRDFTVLVAEACRPEVLVVARQLGRVVREDHAKAERAHELGIGQVLNDVPDGPLSDALGSAVLRSSEPRDGPAESRRSLGQDLHRASRS